MARRLPPLNALRAFEAAARHASFARAADELHVTPAAVSHQVKALEAILEVRLFRRLPRGLVLTEAGRAYLPGLSDGFDRLARATERLMARGRAGRLTVSVLPSFAARWLVPRLADFRRRHPDLDVHVYAATERVDFARSEVDIGLRYGRGGWPGLHAEVFLTEDVYPVCSPALRDGDPALRDGDPPLREPADLRRHTLLHDSEVNPDEPWIGWGPWLVQFGLDDIDPDRGPSFSDSNMLMEACAAGQGVAIGRDSLVEEPLRTGRLVRPFPHSRLADYRYYIVGPPAAFEKPKVQLFRDWLFEMAGQAGAGAGADAGRPRT